MLRENRGNLTFPFPIWQGGGGLTWSELGFLLLSEITGGFEGPRQHFISALVRHLSHVFLASDSATSKPCLCKF